MAASDLGRVQFGLSYQGVTDSNGHMVGVVQVNHPDLLDRIIAIVEQRLLPERQILPLLTSRDQQGPFRSQEWCWMDRRILSQLKVAVNVLQTEPEADKAERTARIYNWAIPRQNHPVAIKEIPSFKTGHFYRLQVEQNDQGDWFGSWIEEASQQEDPDVESRRQRDRAAVREGIRAFLESPQFEQLPRLLGAAKEGVRQILNADRAPVNPSLDQLPLEGLQQQLEAAVPLLETARVNWNKQESREGKREALLVKQQQILKIIALVSAIKAKGGTISQELSDRIKGQNTATVIERD